MNQRCDAMQERSTQITPTAPLKQSLNKRFLTIAIYMADMCTTHEVQYIASAPLAARHGNSNINSPHLPLWLKLPACLVPSPSQPFGRCTLDKGLSFFSTRLLNGGLRMAWQLQCSSSLLMDVLDPRGVRSWCVLTMLRPSCSVSEASAAWEASHPHRIQATSTTAATSTTCTNLQPPAYDVSRDKKSTLICPIHPDWSHCCWQITCHSKSPTDQSDPPGRLQHQRLRRIRDWLALDSPSDLTPTVHRPLAFQSALLQISTWTALPLPCLVQ